MTITKIVFCPISYERYYEQIRNDTILKLDDLPRDKILLYSDNVGMLKYDGFFRLNDEGELCIFNIQHKKKMSNEKQLEIINECLRELYFMNRNK